MSVVLYLYLFILGCSGFAVLLVLSIMAFCNNEAFEISENKHVSSGVMLMVNSVVYLAIAIGIKAKYVKDKKREGYM